MNLQKINIWAAGLLAAGVACGPAGPQETTEGTSEGTTTTTGEGTTTDATGTTAGTTDPTTDPTTGPIPECGDIGGYYQDCGPCFSCYGGYCEPDFSCEHNNECYGYDEECGTGEFCFLNFDYVCEPVPSIPVCERQTLQLSMVEVEAEPDALLVADLDGDGDRDIVTARTGEIEVLLGDGAGGLTPGGAYPTGLADGPLRLATGDFDGDGEPDLAVLRDAPAGELALLFGQDAMFAMPGPVEALGAQPAALWAGDVDGDGAADLLVHNAAGADSLSFRPGDGMGGFGPEVGGFAEVIVAAGAGDGDGDGALEVAVSLPTRVFAAPRIDLLKHEVGGFMATESAFGNGSTGNTEVLLADLDGDGTREIVGYRKLNGIDVLAAWAAGVLRSEAAIDGFGEPGDAGDVDGDGRADIAVFTSISSGVTVVYSDEMGRFSCVQVYETGLPDAPNHVAAGDLDGDGKADLVVAGPGAGLGVLLSGP